MGTLVFQATLGGAVNIIGPNIANTINFTLPSADGTSGQTWTTNGSGVLAFGTLGIAGGGTGQITATAAFNALAPSQSGQSGKYLTTDGTNTSWGTNPLGTVTSVAATVPSFLSISGSPITTSGTLAFSLSGTALPTTSGGTGLTSFTSGGVVYASSGSALATGSALTFDGTSLDLGTVGAKVNFATTGSATRNYVGGSADGYSLEMVMQRGASQPLSYKQDFGVGHVWSVTGSTALTLNSTSLYTASGINVGIGTSSPNLLTWNRAVTTNTASGNVAYELAIGGSAQAYFAADASNIYLAGYANKPLLIRTNNTTALTIDTSGNLGLGVTPSAWSGGAANEIKGLSLWANATNGGYSVQNAYYNGSNWIYKTTSQASYYLQGTGIHSWHTAASGTAGNPISFTQAMTLTAGNQLLVGTTTSPSGSAPALVVQTSVGGGVQYAHGSGGGGLIYALSAGGLTFNTYTGAVGSESYSERARIDSSGNFLVGATSVPSPVSNYKSFVVGGTTGGIVDIGTTSTSYGRVSADSVGLNIESLGATTTIFRTNNTERARIDSSGNLLIDTTSTSGAQGFAFIGSGASSVQRLIIGHPSGNASGSQYHQFYYNGSEIGSITQAGTTGVLYNVTSDYRLKTVVGAVTGHGARIDALEPVEYTWNSDGSRTRGFLAHKFQEVYAGSVTGTKDAVDADGKPVYQAMQAGSSEVIADLVAEIQSLRQRLSAANL